MKHTCVVCVCVCGRVCTFVYLRERGAEKKTEKEEKSELGKAKLRVGGEGGGGREKTLSTSAI